MTLIENKGAAAPAKQQPTYRHAVDSAISEKSSVNVGRAAHQNQSKSLHSSPKVKEHKVKEPGHEVPTTYSQVEGQYLAPPATPNNVKSCSGHELKNPKLRQPKIHNSKPNRPSWDTLYQTVETADTVSQAGRTSWDILYRPADKDEITEQVLRKIYSASIKDPRLATKSSRSSDSIFYQLAQIAESAIRHAQGKFVASSAIIGQKSAEVKAAEGYKKAVLTGKISNVLSKTEQAHLDVIIASQYWDSPLPDKEDTPSATAFQFPKSIAGVPGKCDTLAQSSTKNWGQNEYLLWAKRNLTDATAIKVAKTYCDHLENGTAPMRLFSMMGKQAPPGTSFKDFSLLPYELREQIWLLALEKEKNDVRLVWRYKQKNGHSTHNSFINANNQQRLLFVNHELRNLALKHNYELAFGTRHSPPQTYFDFKRDRLFIHTRGTQELYYLVRFMLTKDVERVQNLAIPLRDFVQGKEHHIARALCKFKNVKRIHLVCGDGLEDVTFCGAGNARLAKNIQRFLYDTWRKHNDPHKWPKVRMYTLPAMTAQFFRIDNMLY